LILLTIAALLRPAGRATAQAPGYAEILTPSAGISLAGLISIEGTADHPAFLRYDLAFAYDPNPTDTWYPLGEPVPTRAQQTTLGLWDTTSLSPGIYQLRLRVQLEGGAILEDIIRGLRIGLPAAVPESTTGPVAPSPTPRPATPVPSATPSPAAPLDPVGLALGIGGLTAAALLFTLALYSVAARPGLLGRDFADAPGFAPGPSRRRRTGGGG
jgi:hypothetical protein